MENNLSFAKTMSMSAFKTANNIDAVKLIKSPKTGKCFFTSDTGVSGKVSETVAAGDFADVSVSLCDDGVNKPFFMIHKTNENNVIHTW
jgi:hypothetical protein